MASNIYMFSVTAKNKHGDENETVVMGRFRYLRHAEYYASFITNSEGWTVVDIIDERYK